MSHGLTDKIIFSVVLKADISFVCHLNLEYLGWPSIELTMVQPLIINRGQLISFHLFLRHTHTHSDTKACKKREKGRRKNTGIPTPLKHFPTTYMRI